MTCIAKKLLLLGAEILMVGTLLTTILAFGYYILFDCGLFHALPDAKQEDLSDAKWFEVLTWLAAGIVSVGFSSLFLGVVLVVLSLRQEVLDGNGER